MTEDEITEGWRQARIQQVLHLMRMNDLTLEDLRESEYIGDMVSITRTQTPHQPSGNTVAGE